MSQSLSRRSFLKCAGSGAVSLAAALLTGVSAAALAPCYQGEPALLDGKAAVELLGYAPAPGLGGALVYLSVENLSAKTLAVGASYLLSRDVATTDELYNVLVALKKYNDGAAPLCVPADTNSAAATVIFPAFGKATLIDFEEDENNKVVYNRTTDQYRYYMQYMHKLYAEGLLHQEYATLDGNTKTSLATAGKTVFMDGTANGLAEDAFPSGKVELNALGALTSEYSSEKKLPGQSPISMSGGFFINAESKYIKELCRAFDIMYATKEVAPGTGLYGESFCYGNEGVNWKYSNDEHTKYDFILPEGVTGSFTSYQYSYIIFTNSGRATALKGCVTSTPGNNQARQLGFVNNVIPYQDPNPFPTNFLKFTDDEQTVVTDKYTDIKKYVTEMNDKFISGIEDINSDAKWNEYTKRIADMGIDEVLKVYQASYDRWLSL